MKLPQVRKYIGRRLAEPLVPLVSRTSISPNALSWLGFLLAVGAALLITGGYLIAAGIVVLTSGFCDMLDGALARRTNRVTPFGSVLDSTLDRLSEAVLLLGILGLFLLAEDGSALFTFLSREGSILLIFITLLGSTLVSYIRARAEAVGVPCQVGVFTRAERVVALVLGLLLNQVVMALMVIAFFSFITVVQRLLSVAQGTKN